MGEFSLMHWLVVAVIVLFVFGAKRLPEMGAAMGKGIREFKRSVAGLDEELKREQPSLAPPDRDRTAQDTRRGEPKRLSQ